MISFKKILENDIANALGKGKKKLPKNVKQILCGLWSIFIALYPVLAPGKHSVKVVYY